MTSSRTTKPRSKAARPKAMSAAKLRALDFERVSLQPDAARLAANADISVERAQRTDASTGQRGNLERARRLDAFEALREGMPNGAYDAARRLERDIVTSRGEHDNGRPLERVQGDEISAFGRLDQIIAAGERVRSIMMLLSDRDGWLLRELISPSVETLVRAKTWREIVAYITGETHTHGQASAVRSACANLADAYLRLEQNCRGRAA